MAEKQQTPTTEGPPAFSDVDKAKARRWFQQAKQVVESRNYDYGIECYITGLGFWPEAVEEGHKPLRLVGVQRLAAGGKKPGMADGLKLKLSSGKDAKQAMLSAEELMAKDPKNADYMEGVLKGAHKVGYTETIKWIAPVYLDALKSEKKPSASRLKALRDTLEQAAERADTQGDSASAVWLYEQAVAVAQLVVDVTPNDGQAVNELRNLNGKLTITRGKYSSAGDFRDSLQDAGKAKLLHDTDRVVQADDAVENLITAARREMEANPGVPAKVNALIDHLLRRERKAEEDEAIQILLKAFAETKNFNFRVRADEIKLKVLNRQYRQLRDKAKATGADEDKQQARLALVELLDTEIDIFTDRVKAYPTDLRAKFRLGQALFRARRFDDAIPVFQEAQMDPKSKVHAMFYMGRCFYEREIYEQACEIIADAVKAYEIENDDLAKEMLYWLGRASEAANQKDQAVAAYGRLLRVDYNYGEGDVRKRLEGLRK